VDWDALKSLYAPLAESRDVEPLDARNEWRKTKPILVKGKQTIEDKMRYARQPRARAP